MPWYTFGLSGREAVAGVAATGTIAVGVPAAATSVLGMIGFTTTGVTAGSIAAAWQATIGNVAAHSIFSWLQSLAALGGFGVTLPVMVGAGAITRAGICTWRAYR